MILETLQENFKNIVVVDTEFKGQQDEGQLNDPICVVFEEITRGEQHIFEGKKWKLPYPSKDTLYIAHNVIAEASAITLWAMYNVSLDG